LLVADDFLPSIEVLGTLEKSLIRKKKRTRTY